MENRFHRYRQPRYRLFWQAGVVAGLSILTGYAHNPESNCQAFISKCQSLRVAGDVAACARWARVGERQCRAEGPRQSWRLLILKAEVLEGLGDYPSALRTLAPEPPNGSEFAAIRARRLNDQASVQINLGKYDIASTMLDRAEHEMQQILPANRANLSDIVWNQLSLYGKTGRLDEARKVVDQLRDGNLGVDKAHLFGAYGFVLDRSARFEEAARYFELALAEPGVNPLEAAAYQNNLASIYYRLGDLDQALRAATEVEPTLRRGSDRSSLRMCLNTIGLVHMDKGELALADRALSEARQIAVELDEKESTVEVDNNLTSLAIQNHQWDKAAELNRSAFKIDKQLKDAESEQYSLIGKARIMAGKKDFEGALATLAAVAAQPVNNPNPRIEAEVEFIAIYRQLRNEEQARAHYRTARTLIDTVRLTMQRDENKLAWYDSQNELNQEWVRFLVEAGHPEEALESAESSRARLMFERLGKAAHPARRVKDYQAIARSENAALVSYWLMPEFSYAWVVIPDKVQILQLPGEPAVASMVTRYQAFLEDGNSPLTSNNLAGEELEKAILAPVRERLGGATRVILVPDAQLNSLNFETLPVNGHYWIQDVTLTIAPSLNILNARGPAAVQPSILAIGDPTPTREFQKLPSASREMDSIARVFPASTVLRGPEATPAAYLIASDNHSYIHLAAHASAIAEQPLDSAVILSSGRLTARDLLRNPVHAELVTISACRSAGVRSYHGEGLVGLAWVFLQTGAHGVIAGLWDANDNATADLMTSLYERIAKGEQPAPALREAKLQLIAGHSHFDRPYYWGPFQYYRGASR